MILNLMIFKALTMSFFGCEYWVICRLHRILSFENHFRKVFVFRRKMFKRHLELSYHLRILCFTDTSKESEMRLIQNYPKIKCQRENVEA